MSSRIISAVLLPADETEPIPVPVTDHKSINQLVGGWFDAIQCEFTSDMFLAGTDNVESFTAVGYVHDEGLILGMPMNKLATLMFKRAIYGPCVVLSGTSPDGINDGDNYEPPTWFTSRVFDGSLATAVHELDEEAQMLADAFRHAIADGLISDRTAKVMVVAMENPEMLDAENHAKLLEALEMIAMYHYGRVNNLIPKFDASSDEYKDFENMAEQADKWHPSDEDIAKFMNGEV